MNICFFFEVQVQVGESVAKLFQKPGMKKKMVYFGEVDLIYDRTDPDVFCHVRYEDDDEEDFSYMELQKEKRFFQESTIIGFFLTCMFAVLCTWLSLLHVLFDKNK